MARVLEALRHNNRKKTEERKCIKRLIRLRKCKTTRTFVGIFLHEMRTYEKTARFVLRNVRRKVQKAKSRNLLQDFHSVTALTQVHSVRVRYITKRTLHHDSPDFSPFSENR